MNKYLNCVKLIEKVVVSKMEITTHHEAMQGKEQTKKANFIILF